MRVQPEGMSRAAFETRLRGDMIAEAGITVIIGGLGRDGDAAGVLEEFEMAVRERKIVLPIAATGHAARTAYDRLLAAPADLVPPELPVESLERLGPEPKEPDAMLEPFRKLVPFEDKSLRTPIPQHREALAAVGAPISADTFATATPRPSLMIE